MKAVRNGQDLSAQLQATQQDLARAQAKCVRLDEVEGGVCSSAEQPC